MATTKKKTTEVPASRVAPRPEAARRVEVPSMAARTRSPSSDEISRRAFEIWERGGRQAGRDVENWLQAESELRSQR